MAIEVKTFGGDKMHDDGAQENGLSLLAALGVLVEVWWICDEGRPFMRPGAVGRDLLPVGDPGVRLAVPEGVDWAAAREAGIQAATRTRRTGRAGPAPRRSGA